MGFKWNLIETEIHLFAFLKVHSIQETSLSSWLRPQYSPVLLLHSLTFTSKRSHREWHILTGWSFMLKLFPGHVGVQLCQMPDWHVFLVYFLKRGTIALRTPTGQKGTSGYRNNQ